MPSPTVCTITGNVKNLLGSNVQNCVVYVSVITPFIHPTGGSFISGELESATTNSSGDFSIGVIETTTPGVKVRFVFDYYDGSSNRRQKTYAVVVPNQASAILTDLIQAATSPVTTNTFPAGSVTVATISGMSAANAQAAFAELQADVNTINTALSNKQSTTLTDGHILVGNSSNLATDVAVSGDIAITDAGVTSYSGTVPKAKGGTGADNSSVTFPASGTVQATTPNNHGVLVSGAGATATVVAPVGSIAFPLISGGASADPGWAKLSEAGGGTNQTTYTTGDTLYASATNVLSKLAVGSSGQFLKVAGGVPSWGPGASGINYLSSNPDAETDTTGWSTYADAAGTTPVDGTGGSPNSTWTRTTSSPLRGTGSFLWTKSGSANRQGEGVSYAITLDSADQAKPIMVAFDYTVASGTYADGDLTVYLYDVTNALVIQPAPYQILSVTAGVSQKWTGYFQTSASSTSYRLIIHTASTSTQNYTVKFDNFNVGPTYQSYGAVQDDWTTARTFSPSAGFGTTTASVIASKRVGDTLMVRGSFKLGTAAGSVASISLPSGLAIDYTKLNTTQTGAVGSWYNAATAANAVFSDTGTATFGTVFTDGSTTGSVFFTAHGGANVFTKDNGSTIAATNDQIGFFFEVPIVGWSSNVQVSSDADTRVCAAQYSGNGGTGITANTTNITWSNSTYDTHAAWNGTTFTAPVSGYYNVRGLWKSTASISVNTSFYVNASAGIAAGSDLAGGVVHAFNGQVKLNAGDAFTIRSDTNATLSGSSTQHWISIERVSGPAQIAASESVNCRYTNTAGTTLTKSSVNTVPFATKDYDSHSAFVTDTFTCPMAGKYSVKMDLVIASGATWAAGDTVITYIYKNGAAYKTALSERITGSDTNSHGAHIVGTVNCVQGDAITVRCNPTKAAAGNVTLDTTATFNVVEIERVGN